MRGRLVAVVVVLSLLTASPRIHASKPALVPTMQDLAITWWGLSGARTFILLELDPTGAGTLVLHSGITEGQNGYLVRSTRLARYDVRFELVALGGERSDVSLRGFATKGLLELKMGSASLNWRDKVVMRPWSEVTTALDALTRCRDRIRGAALSDTSVRCD